MATRLNRRPLGNTGIAVGAIGFGAFKIGRNEGIKYAEGYALPDDRAVAELVDGALALGINLIDTAPAYGTSEERLGRVLDGRRDDVVLSTKVGERFENGASVYDFSAEGIARSVEQSLRRLRTDHVDLVLIHSDGDDRRILDETDAVAALLRIRDEGKSRAIGLSGKTLDGHRAALSWADALMVEFNPRERGQEPVLEEAARAGVGILVKKVLASGHLAPRDALPFVLGRPEVASAVIGSLRLAHLEESVRLAIDCEA